MYLARIAGLQEAIVAAHAEWSRTATASDGSTAPATEEGLGGEDFTLVNGLDEDEPAAEPAVMAAPAGAILHAAYSRALWKCPTEVQRHCLLSCTTSLDSGCPTLLPVVCTVSQLLPGLVSQHPAIPLCQLPDE